MIRALYKYLKDDTIIHNYCDKIRYKPWKSLQLLERCNFINAFPIPKKVYP